uniref:RdRp n=1 Tax=Hubei partiti-like virus 43 TaxID=1923051 RepID=A0A1L3KLS9_9VIRU|nr:RdRp [Hubei partiti-like virus 43]
MLKVLPRKNGFSQRHQSGGTKTPFFPINDDFGYHRSPVTKDLIRKDVLEFARNPVVCKDLEMKLAINQARQAFSLSTPVPMLHLNDVFDYDLKIWSSSPGLPWIHYGYKTKRDVINNELSRKQIRWFWHRVKRNEPVSPADCCAYVRSHLCELGEEKARAVWGYPATITLGEAVFAIPLIEAYQKGKYPIAYGYDTAIGGCAKARARFSSGYISALDYSKFDKTVPAFLIEAAFDILLTNIDLGKYRDYGTADVLQLHRMFDYIKRYFIQTPIRLFDGTRYRKQSGIASGSYFTQLVGSIVNYILLQWLFLKQHETPPEDCIVFGDDSLVRSKSEFSILRAQEHLKILSMRLNIQKSAVSTDISDLSFLGYNIGDGIPNKPYRNWMASLIHPEVRDKSWDDFATRALGLAFACSGQNDAFDSLCRAIVSRRHFELSMSKSFRRFLASQGIDEISKKIPSKLEFLIRLKVL